MPSYFRAAIGRRWDPVSLFFFLFIAVQTLVRLGLLLAPGTEAAWNASLAAAFGWGLLFDLGTAAWALLPLVVALALVPRGAYRRPAFRLAFHLAGIASIGILLFAFAAELIFWEEFGARLNFIAVDYLVYTTEVVDNIRESYNLPAIFGGIVLASAAIYWLLGWRTGLVPRALENAAALPPADRWRRAGFRVAACLALGLGLDAPHLPEFVNNYNRELAKNGIWSFFAAFRDNELDYYQFYPRIDNDQAFRQIQTRIALAETGEPPTFRHGRDLLREVVAQRPEIRPNVIQITVESLSAEFLGAYGSPDGLTPRLDALAEKSLVFDQFYSTGTRTDRGMEALTLSVPPTPGRSLVKRSNNENLFSLGSVFRGRGYRTTFLYGGYGYFDNMSYFFGNNGYKVIDRSSVAAEQVTFANAWGACDEDLLRWTLAEADREAAASRPFHFFVMTTSNHRPYTYPAGRIDLPPKVSGRRGAVKYTDFAIGRFLDEAATRPWFANTVFVVVADHCASSAGKTALPIEKYRIPLLIYAPGGQIAPGRIATLASQIDFAPTLLALLGWSYASRFYGWDATRVAPEEGRALIGTYQRLGLLLADHRFAILEPLRRESAWSYDSRSNALEPLARPDPDLMSEAVAYYQSASFLFKAGVQKEVIGQPALAVRPGADLEAPRRD